MDVAYGLNYTLFYQLVIGKVCSVLRPLGCGGGVLEDVLGLEDVLEDTFSSPWPRNSSLWPWPRTLQVLGNVLSSARGQHYFLID